MTVIGLDPGLPPGDVDLVRRCAQGDELAGRELLARHRDAVADSGPSPAYESVDASGEQALVQLRNGSGTGLPFRVLWLSLHTQGRLPVDEERRNPVWDAFCALPLAVQTALWHREVEGQEATAIAALLGTSTDEVRRHLVSAYSAVRTRVEQSSPPSPSRGLASQLLLLQYSLRDVLAGVVLGPAAGRYLVARPRAGRRVPIEVTPTRRRSSAPYVAVAAAVVGAVAAASFLGPAAPVGTSRTPVPQAAPFEPPIVGSYLEVVAETGEQEAPLQPASPTAAASVSPAPGSSGTAGGQTGTTGTSGGGQASAGKSGGQQASNGPGPGSSGGGAAGPGGGSAPGGGNGGTGSGSQNDGPGQGIQNASSQGQSNGVRAHGQGNGGGKAKGNSPGKSKSKGNAPGKSKAKSTSPGSSKGKGARKR